VPTKKTELLRLAGLPPENLGQQVTSPQPGLEPLPGADQQLVARSVTKPVVDGFEAVEVQEQQRQGGPLQPGDRIGVTAPSSGVPVALRGRLNVAVEQLRDRG